MKRPLGLVLDSELDSQTVLRDVLGELGIDVRVASSADDALTLLSSEPFSLAFVDLDGIGADGASFVGALARLRPSLAAVELVRASGRDGDLGAPLVDRVEKPLSHAAIRIAAKRARSSHELKAELLRLREERRGLGSARLAGRSETTERFRERLARIASGDGNALLVGEPGTGKELAARVVHEMSRRRRSPFVKVDCAGAPAERIEAELFGENGSLEEARSGVLFLREIADLAYPLQERLARALGATAGEDGVGFQAPDVRVLAGTARDLASAMAEGRFHEDLYHHVTVQVVPVPPLRERVGDASHLAARCLEGISEFNDWPVLELTPEARWRIDRYPWPGNVRELHRSMEQAALLATEGKVLDEHLPAPVRQASERPAARAAGHPPGRRFREAKRVVVESFEKAFLQDLMERRHGNVTAAAEEAGMLRSALQRLLRKYDLRSASYRTRRQGRTDSPAV
jgi:two-component system nitrogen regulation response regulator NtrX